MWCIRNRRGRGRIDLGDGIDQIGGMEDSDSSLNALADENHDLWCQVRQAKKRHGELLEKLRDRTQIGVGLLIFGVMMLYAVWTRVQNDAETTRGLVQILSESREGVLDLKLEVLSLQAPDSMKDSVVEKLEELDRLMNLETYDRWD